MMYPIGYGPAEHRRALDAMLADMAAHGQRRGRQKSGPPAHAHQQGGQRLILGSLSAEGSCTVDLRVHPEVIARA